MGKRGARIIPRLQACTRKRMAVPKGGKCREEEVWEGEDESEVLVFT